MFNGVPAFEYAYPALPSSVITHFIVRMNQKIDDGLVWRLVRVNVQKLLGGVVSETERKQSVGNTTNIYTHGVVKDSNLIAGDGNTAKKNGRIFYDL
jgi:hypothetical protein